MNKKQYNGKKYFQVRDKQGNLVPLTDNYGFTSFSLSEEEISEMFDVLPEGSVVEEITEEQHNKNKSESIKSSINKALNNFNENTHSGDIYFYSFEEDEGQTSPQQEISDRVGVFLEIVSETKKLPEIEYLERLFKALQI